MNYALYTIALLNIVVAITNIAQIGKPRKPITPGIAAAGTVVSAVMTAVLIVAAIKL